MQRQELVPCACGCGGTRPSKDERGRTCKFIRGHQARNENHPKCKGGNVGKVAINIRVRKKLPQPELCQECYARPSEDLANTTGIYDRDFVNWKYLCTKCHNKLDQTIDMSDRRCSVCQRDKTYNMINRNGRPHWNYSKITGKLLCSTCKITEWRLLRKVRKIVMEKAIA
jgi:hypothetical protein